MSCLSLKELLCHPTRVESTARQYAAENQAAASGAAGRFKDFRQTRRRSPARPPKSRILAGLVIGAASLLPALQVFAASIPSPTLPPTPVGTASAPASVTVTVPAGGIVSSIAILTTGAAGLDLNQRIRRVDGTTGIIATAAGDGFTNAGGSGGYSGDNGPATMAQLNHPHAVAFDAAGNMYIPDRRTVVESLPIWNGGSAVPRSGP